jgi:DNA-binding NtrC family response regulator
LLAHDWPGNQRELEQTIERAVQRTTGSQITRDLLAVARRDETVASPADVLDGTYADLERRILERAIARAGGTKSEAARLLGLKRTTFLDKIRRLGLDESASPSSEDAA